MIITCTHSTKRISCQKNFGKEMNSMSNSNTKCHQLRELHGRLIEELKILKENLREEEHEVSLNPFRTPIIIKVSKRRSIRSNLNCKSVPIPINRGIEKE